MKSVTIIALASLIGLGAAGSASALTVAPMSAVAQGTFLIEKTAVVVTKRVVRRPVVSRTVVVKKVVR